MRHGGFRHVTLHGATQAYTEEMRHEPVFILVLAIRSTVWQKPSA